MERIKCITFDKAAQDNLPKNIKDKMKADRDKARKEHGINKHNMKYLIIVDGKAFLTNWYSFGNFYSAGMIVVDTDTHMITFDGIIWDKIEEDHL